MKKSFLLIAILAIFFSCSDDNGNNNGVVEEGNTETKAVIRITEVNATSDLVVLSNLGTVTTNIANYWLCLGPGTYVQVSEATSDSTNLAPNESVTLSYDVNESADGLSVFSTNSFSSTDPEVLVDYVQWGAENQARVDQAVTAGRWDDASSFVSLGTSYTFIGTSDSFGSSFYETEIVEAGAAIVRIIQVNAATDQVWLSNLGGSVIDVSNYWLCLGPGTYVQVSAATTGETSIEPGENIVLSYDVNESADGLSLFSINTFGSSDPEVLVDYVQWGAADQARVGQAVTAGRWDSTDSLANGGPLYSFDGEAFDFGSIYW